MSICLSPPDNLFRIVGTMACQESSGFSQNANSSSTRRSAVQPRQEDGEPGRDIILEPLLNLMQDAVG